MSTTSLNAFFRRHVQPWLDNCASHLLQQVPEGTGFDDVRDELEVRIKTGRVSASTLSSTRGLRRLVSTVATKSGIESGYDDPHSFSVPRRVAEFNWYACREFALEILEVCGHQDAGEVVFRVQQGRLPFWLWSAPTAERRRYLIRVVNNLKTDEQRHAGKFRPLPVNHPAEPKHEFPSLVSRADELGECLEILREQMTRPDDEVDYFSFLLLRCRFNAAIKSIRFLGESTKQHDVPIQVERLVPWTPLDHRRYLVLPEFKDRLDVRLGELWAIAAKELNEKPRAARFKSLANEIRTRGFQIEDALWHQWSTRTRARGKDVLGDQWYIVDGLYQLKPGK